MARMRKSAGLQTIFSFFLGLMLTAFVGVGVYTFYPPPTLEMDKQIKDLRRQEQAIRNSASSGELTEKQLNKIQEITDERNALSDDVRSIQETWGRNTSIILIVLATIIMAVSLVRAEQLPVISNGLLLGGVLAMLYGVGWIIATGSSKSRFFIMTITLVITLGLGYVRFVRGRSVQEVSGRSGKAAAGGLTDIEQRVSVLEERMDKAADALGSKGNK